MPCMAVRPSGPTAATSPSRRALAAPSRAAPAATDANSAVQSFERRESRVARPCWTAAHPEAVELDLVQPPVTLGRGFREEGQLGIVGEAGTVARTLGEESIRPGVGPRLASLLRLSPQE